MADSKFKKKNLKLVTAWARNQLNMFCSNIRHYYGEYKQLKEENFSLV